MRVRRCMIELSQGSKTLQITMEKGAGANIQNVFTLWGMFSSFQSDGTPEGGVPKARKQWVFTQSNWELRLVDGGEKGVGQIGGGLKYGESIDLASSAVLYNAGLTNRGIEPLGSSGIGSGVIKKAMELSSRLNNGPVSWRLLSFLPEGYNTWQRLD